MAALTAATFNIRNALAWDGCDSWPFRRHALLDTIRNLDADLLGLQEANLIQRRFLRARLPGYRSVGRGRDRIGWGEACPLFYRHPRLRLEEHETRWLSPTPTIPASRWPETLLPRVATVARFTDDATGVAFGVVNTHLDHRHGELRRRAGELIASWLDPALPWLVMGDFNAPPDDLDLDPFLASGGRDLLGSLPPRGVGCATYHGFTGTLDGPRIDYLLAPAYWPVEQAGIAFGAAPARLGSDHWPVRVTFRELPS